jgi:hypothetical protein
MKITFHRRRRTTGATLVEMVAAIIILGLVVTGVAQFLLVSKINVYTDNVKAGVVQALSDTIVKYQAMGVGETNVPVCEDLLPHIPSGTIRLEKAGPANGVYTVQGSVTWRAFPYGDESFLFHEKLTLEVPE